MRELVAVATERPVNKTKIASAIAALKNQEGEGTLIETSAVIGSIDMFNRVATATGRPAIPSFMFRIMKLVFGILRFVYGLFYGQD